MKLTTIKMFLLRIYPNQNQYLDNYCRFFIIIIDRLTIADRIIIFIEISIILLHYFLYRLSYQYLITMKRLQFIIILFHLDTRL